MSDWQDLPDEELRAALEALGRLDAAVLVRHRETAPAQRLISKLLSTPEKAQEGAE